MSKKTVVTAKMEVQQVSKFVYGEVVGMKAVHAVPVAKGAKEPENTKFAKSIPAATIEMQINKDSEDFGKLNAGDEVIVTFTVCPKGK